MQQMTDSQFATATVALRRAIREVGGAGDMAKKISDNSGGSITRQGVSGWTTVPTKWVGHVSDVSGVPRHELRPDIYDFGGGQ